MRTYDNGCFFTVAVSEQEVTAFNHTWPCSSLPERPVAFRFDKRNGDLVDILTTRNEEFDGSEAVALSTDAMKYGARKLKLELVEWHPAFKE